VKVEDGWTGWRLSGRTLAIVFAAPAEADGEALLTAAVAGASSLGLSEQLGSIRRQAVSRERMRETDERVEVQSE